MLGFVERFRDPKETENCITAGSWHIKGQILEILESWNLKVEVSNFRFQDSNISNYLNYDNYPQRAGGVGVQIRNRVTTASLLAAIALVAAMHVGAAGAQQRGAPPNPAAGPAAQGARGARGGGGGPATAYPQRPPADPAVVERGRLLFSVNCAFCHGNDARGGEGGPNLLRSETVLNDDKGELIANVARNGVSTMPKFQLTDEQIADIAAFIHSFRVGGYDVSRQRPATIVVGDAKAGEAYFQSKCASCHSVTGDLKGFAARMDDPRTLQQTWLMPGGGRGGPANARPTTVKVTPKTGPAVEGRLVRIDDFLVTLADADGAQRSFIRDGDTPKVEVHDPLQPHKDLLRTYTDKNIHDVTAYLESTK